MSVRHHVTHRAGEELWLLPDHAVYWPREGALLIADLHLGKAATYRALGQPVPSGTTAQNLARIDALIARHDARQVVFLGDFLHAAQAQTPAMHFALSTWRAKHAALRLTLVRGNHDSRAGDPPAFLGIDVVDEPFGIGPFDFRHHPQDRGARREGRFVFAGHVHPVHSIRGRARDGVRLPCFYIDESQAILPAFGEFTGGFHVDAEPGIDIFLAAGEAVLPVPQPAPSR